MLYCPKWINGKVFFKEVLLSTINSKAKCIFRLLPSLPPPLLNCADPFIPTFKPLNISFAGNPDT